MQLRSVYGVKKEKEVTEKLSLEPISIYNKTKMTAERILMSYSKNLNSYIIRPATVCGFSERMRLDLSVNILTFSALKNKMITVFGGNQLRPNIHIKDMVRVYEHFLFKRNKTGIYNAGFENEKIINIAKKSKKIECKIKAKNSNDPRSYRLNSDKLIKSGFKPHFGINDAIKELTSRYKKNELIDNPKSYNINCSKRKLKNKSSFVSGNFNVIHNGHIRLFKFARSLSDKLIVGLYSDDIASDSVEINMNDRLEALKEINIIDEIVIIKKFKSDFKSNKTRFHSKKVLSFRIKLMKSLKLLKEQNVN